jgi:uncharacterized protein YukE
MAGDSLSSDKKYWTRPENLVKWAIIAVLGYVGFMCLDSILPVVIRVLDFALEAVWKGVLLASLAGIVSWVIFSNDLHKLVWYGYSMLMAKVTNIFVTIDPIGVMKATKKKLQSYFEEIKESLGALRGQRQSLIDKIAAKGKAYEHSMNIASQAMKRQSEKGMKSELALQSRKANRLEKSSMTYQALLNKIDAHIAVAEKIMEASEFMIDDISDTIEDETEKRATIHASYKAISAAKRILLVGRDREMLDLAIEANARDYNQKLGEIEQFMEDTKSAITTMDLENGVVEEEAVNRLKEWETRSQALLEGGTGKTKYRVGGPTLPSAFRIGGENTDVNDVNEEPEEEKRQSFADLFDKI